MANFYSSVYQAQNNVSSANVASAASPSVGYKTSQTVFGKLRYTVVPWTLSNTTANADIFYLCTLRLGAQVLPPLCRVVRSDPGTALSLSFGDSTDAVRYCNAIDISAAGDGAFTAGATAATEQYAPTPIIYANQQNIIATASAVNTLTNGATLLFLIASLDPAG
jgi:hypothetical protein